MKSFHHTTILGNDNHSQSPGKSPKNKRSAQFAQQLTLFDLPQENPFEKRQKPQISCIPGISLTSRRKYRVKFGDAILGDNLTIEEARALSKGGTR